MNHDSEIRFLLDRIKRIGQTQPIVVGNTCFPRTQPGRTYQEVFIFAGTVYYDTKTGNTHRTVLPKIKAGGTQFVVEFVPQLDCVRITAKNNKARAQLTEAWLDWQDILPKLTYRLATNDNRTAYLLWPGSKDPTHESASTPRAITASGNY